MVLPLTHAKITVEANGHRYQFDAEHADIGSLDGGHTHFLQTSKLLNKTKNPIQPKEAPVTAKNPAPSPSELTNEQRNGIAVILATAKMLERQKLENARAIDAAIREADKATAEAEHKFNMAVLQILHTCLPLEEIDKALEAQNFGDLTEKTEYVASLDTSMLYQTEA